MSHRHIWIGILVTFVTLGSLNAAPPGKPIDLNKLAADSTLIVTGELTQVHQGTPSTAFGPDEFKSRFGIEAAANSGNIRVDSGMVEVDELIKGEAPSPLFSFEFLGQFGGIRPPVEGYGLFFFKRSSTGDLVLTDPNTSWLPTVRGLSISGQTTVDRIVSLLAETLSSPDSGLDAKKMAILVLNMNRSEATSNALRRALDNSDFEISLNAASTLMARGDASGMDVYKKAFLNPEVEVREGLQEAAANSMGLFFRKPESIPDFHDLLRSSSRYMRRGAAMALGNTGSADATTALKEALHDTDLEVRYNAVVGLSRIANQPSWRPSLQDYKLNESKYLSHWRE